MIHPRDGRGDPRQHRRSGQFSHCRPDWAQLRYIGNRFERARCYREAWEVLATSVEARSLYSLPLWNGPKSCDAEHQGVLVLPRSRDLGDELRVLRFIGSLQRHVDHVCALVEPRLAPLLERSMPGLVCCDPNDAAPLDLITHMAAQERLGLFRRQRETAD